MMGLGKGAALLTIAALGFANIAYAANNVGVQAQPDCERTARERCSERGLTPEAYQRCVRQALASCMIESVPDSEPPQATVVRPNRIQTRPRANATVQGQ